MIGILSGLTLLCGFVLALADADRPGLGLGTDAAACEIPAIHDPKVTQVVYQVGLYRDVSPKVMLSAFEAGWVESRMQNLSCGDRDSLGVFQQRPSQGWGTPNEIQDVEYAASAYFDHAVRVETSTPDLSAGQLAQKVQRSAFPDRYDEAAQKARELIAEIEEPTE